MTTRLLIEIGNARVDNITGPEDLDAMIIYRDTGEAERIGVVADRMEQEGKALIALQTNYAVN